LILQPHREALREAIMPPEMVAKMLAEAMA